MADDLAALPLLRLSQDATLDPGVRFLLLVNAAESLHASTVRDDEMAEYERRRSRFKQALSSVRKAGLAADHAFLKECAEARRPYPLAQRLRDLIRGSALSSGISRWDEHTVDLDRRLRERELHPTDLADRLARCRNVLAHGSAHFPPVVLRPAVELMDLLVRVVVLGRLGFTQAHLTASVERLSRS